MSSAALRAPSSSSERDGRRLYVLGMGWADLDVASNMPMEPERGERYLGPATAYVITGDPVVVIDTGMAEANIDDPLARSGSDHCRAIMMPEDRIGSRLAELGIEPEAVDIVINTHLDFDHCGGNRHFPNARFVVQREQLEFARAHPERCPVVDWDYKPINYSLVDGDVDLHPWLSLLVTPGHIPGHQSVLVRLTNWTVLLTGDAALSHIMFDEERVKGTPDETASLRSIRKLKQVRDATGAAVLIPHDADARRSRYRLAPHFYD